MLPHSNKWQQPMQQNDQEFLYSQEMTTSSYPSYQQNPIGYSGFHQHDTRHLAHHRVQDMHFSNLNNSATGHKNVLLVEELCSPVDSNQNVYVANQQCTFKDDKNFLKKVKIGQENATRNQQQKVIMLLGEIGSGKSTLINAMFNYIMGVEFQYNFSLNLIGQEKTEYGDYVNQAKSQTKWITSYTIHHRDGFTIPFKLTIIDTPGFGDTDGIQRDKGITKQITKFFKNKGENGIDAIDAVGFVAQSSEARLSATQRYIFDSILSLFGKDIKENIFMLLPFADGGDPEVLSALKEAKVPYQQYFDFNNVNLFAGGRKTPMMQGFWEMGKQSFNDFMGKLEGAQTKSLILTKEVLKQRKQLEQSLKMVQRNIHLNTQLLERLHREQEVLRDHERDIDRNKNFTYETYEQCVELAPTHPGIMAINCHNCNVTCLASRFYRESNWDSCFLFGNGRCVNCPNQCPSKFHNIELWQYVFGLYPVTRTREDLLRNYEEAKGKTRNAKQMIVKSQQKIESVQNETLQSVFTARRCIARLGEIALEPNMMSAAEYIDLLIESDKHQGGTKLKPLMELKRQAQERAAIAENLLDDNFDPFEGSTLTYEVEMKEKDGKPFGKLKKLFKKLLPGKK